MQVFIVIIGGWPNIYRSLEFKGDDFYGDGKLICDAMYVESVTVTSVEKIVSL